MKKLHRVLQARKNAPGKTVKSSGTELPPITFLIPTPAPNKSSSGNSASLCLVVHVSCVFSCFSLSEIFCSDYSQKLFD